MGFAKWYVREALKHCQPGDFAAAVAILSDWAAQKPAVRDQPEATPPAAGGASAAAEGSAAATMQQTANQVTPAASPCGTQKNAVLVGCYDCFRVCVLTALVLVNAGGRASRCSPACRGDGIRFGWHPAAA